MKTIALLILIGSLVSPGLAIAEIVLIPGDSISKEKYTERCNQDGYLCLGRFLKEKILNQPSMAMSAFLEELDLTDSLQRRELSHKIKLLLARESLSVDQLDSLVVVCERALELGPQESVRSLLIQLKQMRNALISLKSTENEYRFAVIFGNAVSLESFLRVKYQFKDVFHLTIDHNRLQTNNSENATAVSGQCEKARLSSATKNLIGDSPYLIENERSCSLFESLGRSVSKTSDFIVEYKRPLLWTAGITVLSFFVLQNYNVEFK
jgi:hypothetical protein